MFRAKFTRRYIEVDDDLISVITDIEDDDLGVSTGEEVVCAAFGRFQPCQKRLINIETSMKKTV
jgi:hypothetical protein